MRRRDVFERSRCRYCGEPISGLIVCTYCRHLLAADEHYMDDAADELERSLHLELEQHELELSAHHDTGGEHG